MKVWVSASNDKNEVWFHFSKPTWSEEAKRLTGEMEDVQLCKRCSLDVSFVSSTQPKREHP